MRRWISAEISGRLRLAALAIFMAALHGCAIAPPIQEMSDARQAIAAAREAGAGEHARSTLGQAEWALAVAEAQLQSGQYRPARKSALSARASAFDALLESRSVREADD